MAIFGIIILQVSCLLIINANQIKLVQAYTPNPGPRSGHNMVYDAKNNEIILFGGIIANGNHTPLPNIWIYNFINQKWREITPEVSPSPRFNHEMVYIPLNHTVMLFGGFNTINHALLRDTWFYYPQTNEWINKNPDVSPPKRADTTLIYDSLNHRVLLFGGFQGGLRYHDLWEYNIKMNNWTELNDLNNPSARYGPSLIYNNLNNMTYLFGGRTTGYKNDLWIYNQFSLSWNLISTETQPPTRYWHRMSYVSDTNIGFLFGGTNVEELNDTWLFNFNSSEWINHTTELSPSPRLLFSMIYNSNDKQIYLYGGMGESYTKTFGDLWTFDFISNQWEEIQNIPDSSNFLIDYWWILVIIAVVGLGCIIGFKINKKKRIFSGSN